MKLNRDQHIVSMPVTDYEIILGANYEKTLYDEAFKVMFRLLVHNTPNIKAEQIISFFKKNDMEIEFTLRYPAGADQQPEIIIKTLKYIKAPEK